MRIESTPADEGAHLQSVLLHVATMCLIVLMLLGTLLLVLWLTATVLPATTVGTPIPTASPQ